MPTPEKPHPFTGSYIPLTLGHEFCGRIKEARRVSRFRVGQPVMVDPHVACKGSSCHGCKSEEEHLCQIFALLGGGGAKGGGGLSEDLGEVCRRLTDGKGIDVVFDCAGVQAALESAFDAIAFGGTWINATMWEQPV